MTSVQQVSRAIDQAAKEEGAADHATSGVQSILHVISAALEGTESGWLTRLVDETGTALFSQEEAKELEPKLEPLAAHLRSMLDKASGSQTGGDFGIDEMYEGFMRQLDSINKTVQQFAKNWGILHMELGHDLKDDMYPFAPVGTAVASIIPPFTFGPIGNQIGRQIPLPFRAVVFFAYIALDMVRIFTAIPGFDMPFVRRFLSVIAATVDILRGDWKKALLSFSGFFASSFVWMGFLGKTFLDMFYLIAPDLQDNIGRGILSIGKSMIVGLLLKCFQIFAPYKLRKEVYSVFGEILDKQICKATAIQQLERTPYDTSTIVTRGGGKGVRSGSAYDTVSPYHTVPYSRAPGFYVVSPPDNRDEQPPYLSGSSRPDIHSSRTNVVEPLSVRNRLPTSMNPQAVQSAMSQLSSICSDEIRRIVAIASHNIFLKLALQLMRIPTTLEGLEAACKKLYEYAGANHSWETLLVTEGAIEYLAPNRVKSKDAEQSQQSEQSNTQNKIKEYKAELETYKAELKQIDQTVQAAEQRLKGISDNTVSLPSSNATIETVIKEVFPEQTIMSMFPEFNYNVFLKVIKYIVKVNYQNKQLEGTGGFQDFKNQPEFALTDDTIIQYTKPLYVLFSNKMKDDDKYKILHEKLFEVDRTMNAIQLKEWSLIEPNMEDIENKLLTLYKGSDKEREIQKQEKIVKDAPNRKEELQTAIDGVQTNILALIEQSIASAEKQGINVEEAALTAASSQQMDQEQEQHNATEASQKQAEELRITAEVDKQVQEALAKQKNATAVQEALPINTSTPYGVAAAITKAVGDVLGRVKTPESLLQRAVSTIGSAMSDTAAPSQPEVLGKRRAAPPPAAASPPAPPALRPAPTAAAPPPASALTLRPAPTAPPAPLRSASLLDSKKKDQGGGTRKHKLVRRRLTKKVRFNLTQS